MTKLAICFLALAACGGLPEKTHCIMSSDCLGGEVCRNSVCQSMSNDACGPSRAKCAPEASCSDTADGFACTCNAGFGGDGVTCADINECAAPTSPCAVHATCTNLPATFSCACDAAYAGDGQYCAPTRFTKIAAAGGFTCALGDDGAIYCWGNNAIYDLGDGTMFPHLRPTQVGTAMDWIDVDARANMACGIRSDHSMWCWGFGTSGQIGDGQMVNRGQPTMVISDKPGVGWKAMALGRQQACGLHLDGTIACWGLDRVAGTGVTMPVAVDANTDWTVISTGTVRCGLRGMPGTLYCWGKSPFGDLGLGNTSAQPTPTQVGTDLWKTVKVGYWISCGIRADDALLCWGNHPTTGLNLSFGKTPTQVGTDTWEAISLSSNAIIGLRAGGTAYGWGGNEQGELGLPAAVGVAQPTQISGSVASWSQVSSGNVRGCGLSGGKAYCWGGVGDGYLGNGVTTTLFTPTRIGSDQWTALAGNGPGTCGLRNDGALMCWGNPGPGSSGLGFGNTDPVWGPTRLGTATWAAVTGSTTDFFGLFAFCAIRGGTPYCWGDNSQGQLGIGNQSTPQLSPVAVNVPPGTQWSEIAIADHTCAIKSDASLWCWGNNLFGQLGNGATSGTPTTAPTASLAGSWLHVAVMTSSMGESMTCGIKTDHTLWCWGQDQPPTMTQHLIPTQVGIASDWASLSMGNSTICGIKLNGALWCWGQHLGDGTDSTSTTPVQIGAATDWKTVSAGTEICAIKTGGTLWCWDDGGILGNGRPPVYDGVSSSVTSRIPTQIGSDANWSTVKTNGISCASKTDGSLWCWGYGAAPIPNYVTTPVPVN